MKRWFSRVEKVVFRCREAVSGWTFAELSGGSGVPQVLLMVMKKAIFAVLTCSVALGGAIVGTITGAIKGQTTETGLLHGAGIGAMAGAVTAVQLMELMLCGEPFSKVALLCSVLNGKVFVEWVTPAVLKAYQWQIGTSESSSGEISDIYEVNGTRGLSRDSIRKLHKHIFHRSKSTGPCHGLTCTICLEDFKNGDCVRALPSCRHAFHIHCIDEWLIRHGCCPICREDIPDVANY